jgi:hypothetical protein
VSKEPSQATVLAELALERFEPVCDDSGAAYAVPREGPRLALPLRGGRLSLRALLAREYLKSYGRAAAGAALADALLALEGFAVEAAPVSVHLRVAKQGGDLWLDLGDEQGRAVRVTPDGWKVTPSAPVLSAARHSPPPCPHRHPAATSATCGNWSTWPKPTGRY